MTRVYVHGGKVAHLLRFGVSPNSHGSAVCGLSPEWSTYWCGTGSQKEADYVAGLRLCKKCEEQA